jgi:hypothetical protein
MFVTVVRSKLGAVVELPGGINIRPFNFVELKKLDDEMKKALVVLQKAGSVDVAQIADVSDVMQEGRWENMLPSDTTGAASALFQSDSEVAAVRERVAAVSDLLTDYSKTHVLTAEQLEKRKADEAERLERAEKSGDGMPVMRVVAVDAAALAEDRKARAPGAKPTNAGDAEEQLGEEQVQELHQSVDDLAAAGASESGEAAKPKSRRKQAEVPAA